MVQSKRSDLDTTPSVPLKNFVYSWMVYRPIYFSWSFLPFTAPLIYQCDVEFLQLGVLSPNPLLRFCSWMCVVNTIISVLLMSVQILQFIQGQREYWLIGTYRVLSGLEFIQFDMDFGFAEIRVQQFLHSVWLAFVCCNLSSLKLNLQCCMHNQLPLFSWKVHL